MKFGFGENWLKYLSVVCEDNIVAAERSLGQMLGVANLQEKTFLDIGSGSGLFSLAARRLGARVHSFDYDPRSVECSAELKRRYFPDDAGWQVTQGSILSADYVQSLGMFDIVYAWGVLHHTGSMWQALSNAGLPVKSQGVLFISIYNDQGWLSKYWLMVKKLFNKNKINRNIIIVFHLPFLYIGPWLSRLLTGRLKIERGMSLWYDMLDWLGGYPFEVATAEKVIDFYQGRGFTLVKVQTCGRKHGCNEFIFTKK